MNPSQIEHKILIVNDSPDQLQMMDNILGQAGYRVMTADDGRKGLDSARHTRPDLIVSDVSMPQMDGIELCRLVRADAEMWSIPILLVSGLRKDAASVVEGLQSGADDYLEAPYNPMVLITRVARLLEVRRMNEELERRVIERTTQLEAANLALKHEIDERQQVERKLRSQAAMLDLAHSAIIVRDLDSKVVYWNPSAVKTYGWSAEEALGKVTHSLLQTKAPLPLEALDSLLFSDIGAWEGELRHVRRDGTEILVESRQTAVRDEDGSPSAILEVNRDITRQRLASEKLREGEELYRLLVDGVKDHAFYMLDVEGRITSWNQGAERIKGYRAEEIIGEHFSRFYTPQDIERGSPDSTLKEAASKGRYEAQAWRIRKDGTRFFANVLITALRDEAGRLRGFSKVTHDITERKQSEKALRQIEDRLQQSQKLEAVGQLAGGVAHDFNNLLTVIIGQSQLLLRRLKEDSLRRSVEEIRKAGERAALLTQQLLAFSRKQILQPKVLDLNAVISETDKILRRLIEENIDIRLVLDPDLGKVKADPGQLSQVIINLTINARDAMPQGGHITLETKNVYLDEEYAKRHVFVRPGNYVLLGVSDTGTGIGAGTQKHIFEPFFTTKEIGKGTGLGLSTVYGIVKQSGGNIWVYSEVGYGATFKIYLPRIDEETEPAAAEATAEELPQGDETILMVEDEEAIRDLARDFLESCGYKVMEAANGEEAVAICEDHDCSIDLLITDVVLPHKNGREVADKLTATRPQMRVLFMSGYTENAIVQHGVLDEGTNFISKPFSLEELASKVRELLDETDKD